MRTPLESTSPVLQTLFLLKRLVALSAMPLFAPSPPFPGGADVLAALRSPCPLPLGLFPALGYIVTTLTPHLAVGREYTWGNRCPFCSKQHCETQLQKILKIQPLAWEEQIKSISHKE